MTDGARRPPNVAVGVPLTIFGIIALVLVGSFLLQRGWETNGGKPTAEQQAAWQTERASAEDPLVIGEQSAPVELVIYSDYQCPFCSHWNSKTLPKLQRYIDDGDLRVVWRDTGLSGEASERGARAVYAAALQDEFLAYHDALMANPKGASDDELSEESLIALADELGLNVERFKIDFASPEVERAVEANEQEARSGGVTRAPSFEFNGDLISGYQPTDAFIENIDAALHEQDE
ncbi:thioredoxin domain-containing protein [Leucobacter ruminantium]|uniref:Thioredoxin domain-containing protein n=1 Tax=Leucobacter ruminantium TaxID=1289170 RepID=A0A939LUU6_9MICO|nr:thioredoxin domain-containing protein [Leucobacter ruminantium]